MAKRPHWTAEQVLQEILSDELAGEPELEDEPEAENGRGKLDRDEPFMEGSDEEFSDFEELEGGEGSNVYNTEPKLILNNQHNLGETSSLSLPCTPHDLLSPTAFEDSDHPIPGDHELTIIHLVFT